MTKCVFFCHHLTVHEDFIDGVKVSEASRLSKEAGYLLQPETIDTPASDINETQLDEDIGKSKEYSRNWLPLLFYCLQKGP